MMIITSGIPSAANRKSNLSTLNDKLRNATFAEAGSASLYEENLLNTLVSDFAHDAKSNPENLINTLHESFGDKATATQIEQLASSVISGEVTMPASIEFVNAGTLGAGVSGIYIPDNGGRILLDGSLVNDTATLEGVFAKEFGHHLGAMLEDSVSASNEAGFSEESLLKGLPSIANYVLPNLPSNIDNRISFSSVNSGLISNAVAFADPEAANTELFNRLVDAIQDARSGTDQSEAGLVAIMNEAVLALRAQGIDVNVSADSEGRVYQDFRHADLPPNSRYDQLVSGSFGGRGKNDETPNTAIVRIFVENIDDETLLFSAGLISQQLHSQSDAPDNPLVAIEHELRSSALDIAFEHLTVSERDALLDSSNDLQRELQLFHEGSRSKSELADAIVSTYGEFQAHGISGLHRFNEQGQIWLPDAVPNNRGPNASAQPWDRGDFGNLSYQSGQFLSGVVADLLGAPAWHAGMVNLEQFGVFAGESPIHIGSLRDALSPGSLPVDPNDPSLAESLQNALALNGASSSSDLRSLSQHHFTTASHLLTQNARGLSRDDMIAAYGLINADGLEAFGYQESITIQVGGKSNYEESQGPYGGLSRESYQFAQSWLNTSREQRLEHLGLDADKWNQAESFIAQGIEAQKAADKAEFGFSDAIIIAAAVGVSIVVGGATSGLVVGLLPAGTSVATGALIGAAAGSFSSTLILTGDIDDALKNGALAAITGGLAQYTQTLGGAAGQIAQAITGGVASELSGGEFKQGLLNVVGTNFGQSVQNFVGENFNDFIAGFSGKVTQVAIITGGDSDLMEDYLVSYVENFASGQVQSFLSSTVGPHSRTASIALSGLADAVIHSRGNLNEIEAYIEGGEFLQSLAPQLRANITAAFGGEGSLKAALLGNITDIILASNGDLELIEQNIGLLALSVASDWAGGVFTDRVNDLFGTEAHPLVDSVSTLLQAGITSGWDSTTINAIAYGPVLDNLTNTVLQLLPTSVGGAEGFIAGSLETLVTSYDANNGNIEAVARDLAIFIGTQTGQGILAGQSGSGSTASLSLGSSGERVAGVQQSLVEHGYLELDSVLLGEFDQTTADAVDRFQSDQLNALRELEHQPASSEPGALDDRPFSVQFTYLLDEQFRGEVGQLTARLLESPLETTTSVDLISDGEEVSLVDLQVGSRGPEVARLQQVLTDLGYDPGTTDGIFGPNTANALSAFQHQQIGYLNDILGRTENVGTAQRQQLLDERDTLLGEQQDGIVSSASWLRLSDPLDLEAVAQVAASLSTDDSSSTVEDSLSYIRSILNRQPGDESPTPFVLAGSGTLLGTSWTDSQVISIFQKIGTHTSVDQNKIIKNLFDDRDMDSLINLMEEADGQVRQDVLDAVAQHLSGERLNNFYEGASDQMRQEIIQAANRNGSEATRIALVNLAQRDALNTNLGAEARGLSPEDKELLLDIGQISLDLIGIFEPTPFADGTNVVISILRGNLLDAGLSAVSIIPYIGDLAKAGRLGSWAATVETIVSRYGGQSAEYIASTPLGRVALPTLERINSQIDRVQNAAGGAIWRSLGEETQQTLLDLKQKIDNILPSGNGTLPSRPSRVASNTDNLENAGWGDARIARELSIRSTQIDIVDNVDNWVREHNSTVDAYFRQLYTRNGVYNEGAANNAKGNYGEMKADLLMTETHGYIPVVADAHRLTSLDQDWGKQGIDGIYQRTDGSYVVTEVKSNDNGTSTTSRGQQLSDPWLQNHLRQTFPDNRDIVDDILDDASRVLVNYESVRAGDIFTQLVDDFGFRTNTPFNP